MPIESVMPSSHLILCRLLLLLPPIPPSIRVFSNESTLCMRWPKYWRFSFSISPSNEHPGLISFRIDWLDQGYGFLVVMYGCESWTIKKAEWQRIDAFELWCWRRLLRVPWNARRSYQSILNEISPEYSLEGLMLKLKLRYFGHLMWRADSFEKTLKKKKKKKRKKRPWCWERLRAGGEGDKGNEMIGWHHRLSRHVFGWTTGVGDGQGGLACCRSRVNKESDTTERMNWTELSFNISK